MAQLQEQTPVQITTGSGGPVAPGSAAAVQPRIARYQRLIAVIAGCASMVVGAAGLFGWIIGNELLKSLIPGHVAMKANAAACLITLGAGLLLSLRRRAAWRTRAEQLLAIIVIAASALTLAEYFTRTSFGIDQLLFREPAGAVGTSFPGRMAPTTALALLLLGAALLLLDNAWARARNVVPSLAGMALLIALAALLGYSYNATTLYGIANYTQMAFPTALALAVLSVGVWCARPGGAFMGLLTSHGIGGIVLRRLLPLAIGVPWVLGALTAYGSERGLYTGEFHHVLFACGVILVFAAVVYFNARSLDRLEQQRELAEISLRRSRDQWEQTFNCMSEGLSYHDPEYNIIGANEALYQLLGEDMLAGKKCYEVVHHTSEPPDYCPMRRTLKTGRVEASEFFEPRLRRHLAVRTDPVFDAAGSVVRIVHVVEDVTERREAEQAVRQLAAIVESSSDAIIGKDLDGRIVSWNRGAERIYGYTAAEVVGRHISLLSAPESPDDWKGVLDRIRTGQAVQHSERPRRRKDGSLICVSITVSPIRDGEGAIVGASTIARDITEHKRAEEEIRRRGAEAQEARMRLDALFFSIAEGVYQLDAEACLQFLNPAGEKMLGYRLDEIKGRHMHEIIHSRLPDGTPRPAADCPLTGVIANGQVYRTAEDYFQRKDGSFFPVEYTSAPLVLDGQVTGAVLSFRDISERKRAEAERARLLELEQQARRELEVKKAEIETLNAELEERVRTRTAELEASNKELEAFSYSVSHDLRAPLRSLDGFSHILLDEYGDRLDEEGRDFLHRVRAASQNMGQLIDSLLQLSRVSRSEMRREPVDLSATAREVIAELKKTVPERQVEFTVAEGLTCTADAKLLHVLLHNLLGNAWKFTSRRRDARIEFGAADHDGHPTYFVRDNGAGFDMAYANKLFSAFQRLHTASEFEGTGIGLATVQRIVRRHGGQVWAEGAPGAGATFYFTLS